MSVTTQHACYETKYDELPYSLYAPIFLPEILHVTTGDQLSYLLSTQIIPHGSIIRLSSKTYQLDSFDEGIRRELTIYGTNQTKLLLCSSLVFRADVSLSNIILVFRHGVSDTKKGLKFRGMDVSPSTVSLFNVIITGGGISCKHLLKLHAVNIRVYKTPLALKASFVSMIYVSADSTTTTTMPACLFKYCDMVFKTKSASLHLMQVEFHKCQKIFHCSVFKELCLSDCVFQSFQDFGLIETPNRPPGTQYYLVCHIILMLMNIFYNNPLNRTAIRLSILLLYLLCPRSTALLRSIWMLIRKSTD